MRKSVVIGFVLIGATLAVFLALRDNMRAPRGDSTGSGQDALLSHDGRPVTGSAQGAIESSLKSLQTEGAPDVEHQEIAHQSPPRDSGLREVQEQRAHEYLRSVGGWSIIGKVVDEAGLPVPSATVVLKLSAALDAQHSGEGLTPGRLLVVDSTGEFSFGGKLPTEAGCTGLRGFVRAEHPDYTPYREELTITEGGVYRVQAVLRGPDANVVVGKVLNTGHRPMSNVLVRLLGIDEQFERESDITSEDGRFRVLGVLPGSYRVQVRLVQTTDLSFSITLISPERIHVPEGGLANLVILVDHELSPGAVAGRVVNERGGPVSQAKVRAHAAEGAYAAEAWSDKDGTFRFTGVPASVSALDVSVFHTDYQSQENTVLVGETRLEFVLNPKPRVRCRVVVVDGLTQQPILGAAVRPDSLGQWQLTQNGEILVDLSEGRHYIQARASGYSETTAWVTVATAVENMFVIELGCPVELHAFVTLDEGLRELIGGESLRDWITSAMTVVIRSVDGNQTSGKTRLEGDSLVFTVGKGLTYVVEIGIHVRADSEPSQWQDIEVLSEPLHIPENATDPVKVGLHVGGDCILAVRLSGQPTNVPFLLGQPRGRGGVVRDGILELGYTERRTTALDDYGAFSFHALAPGAYEVSAQRLAPNGERQRLNEEVVFSRMGESIQLEWP